MYATMRLRGGSEIVPGFDITTGEWSNVDGKSGRILREGEVTQDDEGELGDGGDDDQDEDEDMGNKLTNFEGVVTVDQLIRYADGECEEGNFDTAANLCVSTAPNHSTAKSQHSKPTNPRHEGK